MGRSKKTKQQLSPEGYRRELIRLLSEFEGTLEQEDLREKVLALVPANELLRRLGASLIPKELAAAARDRILHYFKKYPGEVITGDELAVVAGIMEWARRVRELRVEFGWRIITGLTASEAAREEDVDLESIGPSDYVLLYSEPDRDAAYRWNVANAIRKQPSLGMREKILKYLRENVGKQVTGEELRYVAGDKSEWARRVRELRTEEGWPILTKQSGEPNLPVGVYILEQDRQAPEHDRRIPDPVRATVLRRDKHTCQAAGCGWSHDEWNRSDPRFLELHHIKHHKDKGANDADNLITLCNICHDQIHRISK